MTSLLSGLLSFQVCVTSLIRTSFFSGLCDLSYQDYFHFRSIRPPSYQDLFLFRSVWLLSYQDYFHCRSVWCLSYQDYFHFRSMWRLSYYYFHCPNLKFIKDKFWVKIWIEVIYFMGNDHIVRSNFDSSTYSVLRKRQLNGLVMI